MQDTLKGSADYVLANRSSGSKRRSIRSSGSDKFRVKWMLITKFTKATHTHTHSHTVITFMYIHTGSHILVFVYWQHSQLSHFHALFASTQLLLTQLLWSLVFVNVKGEHDTETLLLAFYYARARAPIALSLSFSFSLARSLSVSTCQAHFVMVLSHSHSGSLSIYDADPTRRTVSQQQQQQQKTLHGFGAQTVWQLTA